MADSDFRCQRSASVFALQDGLAAVATASSIGFLRTPFGPLPAMSPRTHRVKHGETRVILTIPSPGELRLPNSVNTDKWR